MLDKSHFYLEGFTKKVTKSIFLMASFTLYMIGCNTESKTSKRTPLPASDDQKPAEVSKDPAPKKERELLHSSIIETADETPKPAIEDSAAKTMEPAPSVKTETILEFKAEPVQEVKKELPPEAPTPTPTPTPKEDAIIINEEKVGPVDGMNYVINGEFSFPEYSGFWSLFATKEYDISKFGWYVKFLSDTPCGVVDPANTEGLLEIQNHSGEKIAELDSHCRVGTPINTNIEIYQDIELPPGTYVLSFTYKDRSGGALDEGLFVSFGEANLTIKSSGSWENYEAKVEVKGSTQKVRLLAKDTGNGNTLGALVDKFKVVRILP